LDPLHFFVLPQAARRANPSPTLAVQTKAQAVTPWPKAVKAVKVAKRAALDKPVPVGRQAPVARLARAAPEEWRVLGEPEGRAVAPMAR